MQPDVKPVEKHLLVTISDDINALFGLRFVYNLLTRRDLTRITLFSVAPRSGDDGAMGGPFNAAQDGLNYVKPVRNIPASLSAARDWLLNMGFPPDRVLLKCSPSQLGTVKDIAVEAERGLYDAVVLGRRGLGWFDEFFQDSVTHRLLWESITFPLWVCRNPIRHGRNVLLCVDGSDQALRMADHVGFILRNEPQHGVTVFHNRAEARPEGGHIDDMLGAAGDILLQNGIEEERITYLVKSSKHPAELILREAHEAEYAAVAVGRSGGKPDSRTNLFGSISLTLLRTLEGSALWISK